MRASSRAIARLTPEGVNQGLRRPWRRCLLQRQQRARLRLREVVRRGHGEIREWMSRMICHRSLYSMTPHPYRSFHSDVPRAP